MKSLRFPLPLVLMSMALMSLSTVTFAQSDAQKPDAHSDAHKSAVAPVQSDAQKAFTQLKTLAGTWRGPITADPPQGDWDKKPISLSMRVTSRGNLLVHEMKEPGTPDDPSKDDPITTIYLDGDRLLLTHYCDAGNRPRMAARVSPDGKTIEFDFLDVAGSTQYGHMHHAVFTIIDANHHTEEWTFVLKGDKMIHARMDLQRVNPQQASAR